MSPSDFCRQIETYLCRKNDGHLIRIVGPAFDKVRGWEEQGIPLKVVLQGIDRTLARRETSRLPKRRPVRVEFCEADVLDAFDAWRRSVGVARIEAAPDDRGDASGPEPGDESVRTSAATPRRTGLHRHIDRAMSKLTQRRLDPAAPGTMGPAIDAALASLDQLRTRARGARGAARLDVQAALTSIDEALGRAAEAAVAPDRRAQIDREARRELLPFAGRMSPEVHARAVRAATARLLKAELDLPDLVDGG